MTKVVSILSGKGGTGKTTVSINLSLALKKLGYKVILLDGNVSMPHLSTYLGINSYKYSLNDFLSGKDFDREAFVNYNGIKVLISSPNLEDLSGIDLKRMKKIVDNIKNLEKPDFIIIDGPPGLGREVISVIEVSDEIIIVVQPFEQHYIDAIKIKELASTLGKKNLKVILNNGFWVSEKKIEEVEKIINLEILGFIPHNKSLMYSLLSRIPIFENNPNSIVSEIFTEIACKISKEDYKESLKLKFYKKMKDLFSMVFI
ncbi:MAG: P-loop NTPase [Candidatus Aenigmatarchaeota archaeon]